MRTWITDDTKIRKEYVGRCWESNQRGRYTSIWSNGNNLAGHRLAYETFIGPLSEKFQIDHLCLNKACYNPSHLEMVTPKENIARRDEDGHFNKIKNYCPYGHEYTPDNTYVCKRNRRHCRKCITRRSYERRRRIGTPVRKSL